MLGLPITVELRQPVPNLPNEVTLAPFTPDQLEEFIPYQLTDPALAFMPPHVKAAFLTQSPAEFFEYFDRDHLVSWGVHHQERLIGTTALIPSSAGVSAELFLAPGYRSRGFGGMAAAGLLRAVFTPQFLSRQNPSFDARRLYRVSIDIHRQNTASVRLAHRFGFSYVSHHSVRGSGGFRYNSYALYGGVFGDDLRRDKWHEGTLRAHNALQDYYVQSEGDVPIAEQPDEILRPFVFMEGEES